MPEFTQQPRARLADRLGDARKRKFVGRSDEVAMFEHALAVPEPPFALMCITGPGGIGKSTLLREFGTLATKHAVTPVLIDAHDIDPSPNAFVARLANLLHVPVESALASLFELPRVALLLDTYERFAPLNDWLRTEVISQLPAGSLAVLAGREVFWASWHKAGWGELMRSVPMRNLAQDEARAMLTSGGVPPERHNEILRFTHGHPLGLAVVAEVCRQNNTATFSPDSPDIISALVGNFVADAPSRQHQIALNTCAHARVTTEPLLREVLGVDDAAIYFNWLRSLSFIETHASGLVPHDLAREVLDRDLEWRDPEAYNAIHVVTRSKAWAVLNRPATHNQKLRAREDLIFSARHVPCIDAFFDWNTFGAHDIEALPATLHPKVINAVRDILGGSEAAAASFWLARQPEAWWCVRDPAGNVLAAACVLFASIAEIGAAHEDAMLVDIFRERLQRLPKDAPASVMRFRLAVGSAALDKYSPVGAITSHANNVAWHTPGVRLYFELVSFSQPHLDMNVRDVDSMPGLFEADRAWAGVHTCEGRRLQFTFYDLTGDVVETGHQNQHEMSLNKPMAMPMPAVRSVVIHALDEDAFAAAVRQAVKDFAIRDALATSPLLRSRVAQQGRPGPATAADLQALLRAALDSLRASPRDEKFYKALWHTYFQPAPTQEAAAELLGLPFNTYRYQLEKGLERISAWLWLRETEQ